MAGTDSDAPDNSDGYKAYWTPTQLIEILSELLGGEAANASWKKYEDPLALASNKVSKITIYKYK